jgi:Na+/phosphate symporter
MTLLFLRKYPPFRYFFYTLAFFEIWEQSWKKYEEGLRDEAEKATAKAKEAREYADKIKLKLDQFMQFLLQHAERKKAKEHAEKILDFFDPNDLRVSYERISQYVDSIIEKYKGGHDENYQ